jgi:hypothetical protein
VDLDALAGLDSGRVSSFNTLKGQESALLDSKPIFMALAICQRLVRATGPLVTQSMLEAAAVDAREAASALLAFADSVEPAEAPARIRAVK